MGGRTRYRKRNLSIKIAFTTPMIVLLFSGDTNPSPNSYSLPVLLGPHIPNRPSSACYSMTGRLTIGGFDTDYAKTPGPARYGAATPDMNAARAPAYSMLSRNFMPGGEEKKKLLFLLKVTVKHFSFCFIYRCYKEARPWSSQPREVHNDQAGFSILHPWSSSFRIHVSTDNRCQ